MKEKLEFIKYVMELLAVKENIVPHDFYRNVLQKAERYGLDVNFTNEIMDMAVDIRSKMRCDYVVDREVLSCDNRGTISSMR